MSLDRIEHARRILADAGDLLTADPMKLYWVARQVQPLLDLLDDGSRFSREVENGAVAPPPTGVAGYAHPRGAPVLVPVKPCCGVLAGDACECAAFAASAEAAFASPLRIGWTR